jgi:hypothetical protein
LVGHSTLACGSVIILGVNFESAPIEMKILATILRMTIERVSIELKILAIILRVTLERASRDNFSSHPTYITIEGRL